MFCFFFFQAEDGIRDYKVTGVQTCALPISAQNGLERVELGTERRAAIARRLVAARKPYHGTAIDPQPPRDLPLREPLRRQRPHLRPLQRAPHLLPPRSTP